MIRFAKALALIIACVAIGCAVTPHVVTVVKPYVAIVVIDNGNGVTWLGQMRCDLEGHPFILVNPQQSRDMMLWSITHERVHIAESEAMGCRPFVERYARDSLFRLEAEADAFCATLKAQLAMKVEPDPPLKTIVWVLHNRYQSDYTEEAVEEAIQGCR